MEELVFFVEIVLRSILSYYKVHRKIFNGLRLKKGFFNFQNDIYLCACYIPPSNSSYFQKLNYDVIETIEKDVNKFKNKGEIMICGDMNARTASSDDLIVHDDVRYLPLCETYKIDNNMYKRNNRDVFLNDRAKELIDFCICNQLRIINGRCVGDFLVITHVLTHMVKAQ